MPTLPALPALNDYQAYVAGLEVERGFDDQRVVEKCLLLGEEVGELFKAVRKREGMAIEASARTGEIADELADIFIMLCSVANHCHVDLESAFRAKEERNKQRSWSRCA